MRCCKESQYLFPTLEAVVSSRVRETQRICSATYTTRGRVDIQHETMDGMALQLVTTRDSDELQYEMLKGV